MFIRHFEVSNFKIHRDTSLDLFPITVFVGPNSGGKSALFDALINFSMVCRGDLSEAFNFIKSYSRTSKMSHFVENPTPEEPRTDVGKGNRRFPARNV